MISVEVKSEQTSSGIVVEVCETWRTNIDKEKQSILYVKITVSHPKCDSLSDVVFAKRKWDYRAKHICGGRGCYVTCPPSEKEVEQIKEKLVQRMEASIGQRMGKVG